MQRLLKVSPEEREAFNECLVRMGEEGPREDALAPATFGRLTSLLISHRGIKRGTKLRACQRLFDAIPLPESEDEVFVTAETVPPSLQEASSLLLDGDEFVDYHLLHLIYALYVDPERGAAAPMTVLGRNLSAILESDFEEGLKLLYTYLLLSSTGLQPGEAGGLFLLVLEGPGISDKAKRLLALAAADHTFGAEWFAGLASDEGLYPREQGAMSEILREARVRPLPEALSATAEEWLVRALQRSEKPSKGENR